MKQAAKVFLILGMVIGGITIVPIVIGVFALKAIDEAKKKEDLEVWAILSIFLVSLVGGILMLFITDEELNENPELIVDAKVEEKTEDDYIANIKKLKELFDSGAITKEEYEKLKAKELAKGK